MGMFVEDNEVIEIKINYTTVGKKIELCDEPGDGVETLSVVFKQPNFSASQRLIAASTTVDNAGSSAVNVMLLQTNMLYFLAKSWNAKNADGSPMVLNNENIGKLRVEISRALINKLSQEVGQVI